MSSDEFSSNSEATDSESDSLHNASGIRLIRVIHCRVPPHFPFTGQPGLQVALAENNDPLTCGQLFLDDQIYDLIVSETNQYTEQTLTRPPHRRLSRRSTRQSSLVTGNLSIKMRHVASHCCSWILLILSMAECHACKNKTLLDCQLSTSVSLQNDNVNSRRMQASREAVAN